MPIRITVIGISSAVIIAAKADAIASRC
jgi:hypothetical protein